MSDNLNDDDDEKKEDSSLKFVDPESSDHFKKYAEMLFDITLGIYDKGQSQFKKTKFDFYTPFYSAFQTSEEYKISSVNGHVIKTTLAKIFAEKKWRSSLGFLNRKISSDTIVEGLLFMSLQKPDGGFNDLRFDNENDILATSAHWFQISNCYFALSPVKKSVKVYWDQETKCRIAICLTLSPHEFWSDYNRLSGFFDEILSHDCVKALKIRSVADIGSGDALLLYCSKPPAHAWSALQEGITKIFPKPMRRENIMPFATPLDLGINANIPINYIEGKEVKRGSFTGALAILSKQAFDSLLNVGKIEKTNVFNKGKKRKSNRSKNLEDFQTVLSAIFHDNGLQIDESGALLQPVPPTVE